MNVALMETTFRASSISNFVGKVSGSMISNQNIMKDGLAIGLQSPSSTSMFEVSTTAYGQVAILDGILKTASTNVNSQQGQHLFSFNLIEYVIRNYGVGVFGNAVLTSERVAWLKANITRITGNWWGFGSGPSGYRSTFDRWNVGSNMWNNSGIPNNSPIVALNSVSAPTVTSIDSNGFVHFLAYAEASNGTIASSINTDYVELIVELNITQ